MDDIKQEDKEMGMFDPKKKKIVAGVIAVIVAVAMVIPMVLQFIS